MSAPCAVVLLSGGLDSAVCLALAREGQRAPMALTFSYGQRACEREIEASRAMCERLGIKHQVVELPWLAAITRTALVDSSLRLPEVAPAQLDDLVAGRESAKAVWVPNRNGVFVMAAAAFAEALGAPTVVAGFNAEEAETFPDNSAAFVEAMNATLCVSTLSKVKLAAPTKGLTKPQIVRLGRDIGVPLEMIWSCYEGGQEHCWRCESCRRLERALRLSDSWDWWQEQRKLARTGSGAS